VRRPSYNILHVEAGPTYGGSTGILEGYLVHGDHERLVRDVLFHYRVPGTEVIEKNCRRFICLDRPPPEDWDVSEGVVRGTSGGALPPGTGSRGAAFAQARGGERQSSGMSLSGDPGAQAPRGGVPGTEEPPRQARGPEPLRGGALRRAAKRIPGAGALVRSLRSVATFVGVELPLAFRVAREARMGRCDLIHSNNTPTIQRSTIIAAAIAGKPAVANVRTSVRLGRFDRHLANRCSLIIAQSESVEKELRGQNLSPPIVACFDGVPIPSEPFPVSSDIKGELLGTSDTVIGGVGRLVDRKGFRYLIEAMPGVLERHSRVTVALAGDGPLRRDLEDLAASLGIGNKIRFLGFRRDIRYVLQAIDIFALPSLKEGLPLTMLEAMAEGRPTVASAVDGVPTFVHHERTGLLVPPRDPGRLAEALIRLLDDKALAARLGRDGRALAAREGSVKKTASKVDDLLLQVLEGGVAT